MQNLLKNQKNFVKVLILFSKCCILVQVKKVFEVIMYERYETFTSSIVKIHRFIYKIKAVVMAEYNLKSPHVSCLYYLGKSDGITASEICELSSEDKSSISRSVDYLEKNGYILCAANEGKRYKAALTLTEKGRQVSVRMDEIIADVLKQTNKGLSEEDLKSFYDALLKICDNLQNISDDFA